MTPLCDSIETLAMALHDGELAGEELRDVELHLTECASCRDHSAKQAAELSGIRRKLAAPPAPDLLRARVLRGLDAEDRAARRPLASWLLPGAAAVAAVAALFVFVAARPAPPKKDSVLATVAEINRPDRPVEVEGAATPQWVEEHYQPGVALPTFAGARVDRWGARLTDVNDRRAVLLIYRVTTPEGITRDLEVNIFDAHNLDIHGGRTIDVDGRVLRYGRFRGRSLVSYVDGHDRAYVFTSNQTSPEELVELVGTSSLLMHVRDDERRR